jgi:hypothetical protein
MKRYLIAAAAVAGLVAGAVSATPSADAAGLRLLDFEAGEFSNVVAGGSTHYYLTYTLKNNRDEASQPKVRIEVRTETDRTYGDHHDARVAEAVAEATGNDGLHSGAKIRGAEIASGASTEGLANFGRVDPNADELQVRVYGLFDPVWRDRKGNVYSERRVLVLNFRRYGDEYSRHEDAITLLSTTQEVEGEPQLLSSAEK